LVDLYSSPSSDLLVLPMIAGIAVKRISEYFSQSTPKLLNIPPYHLPPSAREAIATVIYESQGWRDLGVPANFLNDSKFQAFLRLYGDFPRGLEQVLIVYHEALRSKVPFREVAATSVFTQYSEAMKKLVPQQNTKEIASSIFRSYFSEKVFGQDENLFFGAQSIFTVSEAMDLGLVSKDSISKTEFKLRVPISTFVAFRSLFDGLPQLEDAFKTFDKNGGDLLQAVGPGFLIFRANVLFGPNAIVTLADLLPGAQFYPPECGNRQVQYPPHLNFETLSQNLSKENLGVAKLPGRMVRTAERQPGFDCLWPLQTLPEKPVVLLAINWKKIKASASSTAKSAFSTSAKVLKELNLNDTVVGIVASGTAENLPAFLDDLENKPEAAFLINQTSFREFFGPFSEHID